MSNQQNGALLTLQSGVGGMVRARERLTGRSGRVGGARVSKQREKGKRVGECLRVRPLGALRAPRRKGRAKENNGGDRCRLVRFYDNGNHSNGADWRKFSIIFEVFR